VFDLQDKEQPDAQDGQLLLALDDQEALNVAQQPGTDGFRMDSAPLFTVIQSKRYQIAMFLIVYIIFSFKCKKYVIA